jgi:hypothetical protein
VAGFHTFDLPASQENKLLAILERQLHSCLSQSSIDGNQLIKG